MRDTFSQYHPCINFGFFVSVIGISMFIMHPIFLGISLLGAITYSIYLNGKRALRFNIFMVVPALLLMAIINPTFNHRGETILLYVNDNPLTLESIIYGVVTAAMLVAMILWFSCYNSVMTSDKFIYIFGRVIPSLSLLFSMVLRFVPRFKAQIKIISHAQKCIGRDISQGSIWKRVKNGLLIVSIMITWVLENSIDTADSMKARGYGLRRRTAFSIFRLTKRDQIVGVLMSVMVIGILIGFGTNMIYSMYIPRILINETNLGSVLVYCSYFFLCFMPVILNIWEDIKWSYLRSRM